MARGPVQPAAQCSLQQSEGLGPLHLREHCSAQFNRVTDKEDQRTLVRTLFTHTFAFGELHKQLNLQVWQFSGPGAQHDPLKHAESHRMPEVMKKVFY